MSYSFFKKEMLTVVSAATGMVLKRCNLFLLLCTQAGPTGQVVKKPLSTGASTHTQIDNKRLIKTRGGGLRGRGEMGS